MTLRPSLAFDPDTLRRLSTPSLTPFNSIPDAIQLRLTPLNFTLTSVASHGTTLRRFQLRYRAKRLDEARATGEMNATARQVIRSEERATRHNSRAVAYLIPPLLDFTAALLAVSWSELDRNRAAITPAMSTVLMALTAVCISLHALYWFANVSYRSKWFYADVIVIAVGWFVWSEWRRLDAFGRFDDMNRNAFVALSVYRFLRLWVHGALFTADPATRDLRTRAIRAIGGSSAVLPSRLETVFVTRRRVPSARFSPAALLAFNITFDRVGPSLSTDRRTNFLRDRRALHRSAPFAMMVWDDLEKWWFTLERKIGAKSAEKFAGVRVFCTDRDPKAVKLLVDYAAGTRLAETGALVTERPHFEKLFVDSATRGDDRAALVGLGAVATRTLVTYCGGRDLGKKIDRGRIKVLKSVDPDEDHAIGVRVHSDLQVIN